MPQNQLFRNWAVVGLSCAIVSSVVYALVLQPRGGALENSMAWLLFPGIALYAQLNGSLLFGGGFGSLGDYLVIALGSALAWSAPIVVLIRVVSARWQHQKKPK
ncbi:MAG: hypothetical protein ACREVR_18570 [Burkholderiales bacterium]